MRRSAHMVDLLRPTLTFKEEVEHLLRKHELTAEDLDKIGEQAKMVQRAAEVARAMRYGAK